MVWIYLSLVALWRGQCSRKWAVVSVANLSLWDRFLPWHGKIYWIQSCKALLTKGHHLIRPVIQLGTGLRTFAHIFLKLSWRNFIKISFIIKECPEEILIKLTIVLKYCRPDFRCTGVVNYYKIFPQDWEQKFQLNNFNSSWIDSSNLYSLYINKNCIFIAIGMK